MSTVDPHLVRVGWLIIAVGMLVALAIGDGKVFLIAELASASYFAVQALRGGEASQLLRLLTGLETRRTAWIQLAFAHAVTAMVILSLGLLEMEPRLFRQTAALACTACLVMQSLVIAPHQGRLWIFGAFGLAGCAVAILLGGTSEKITVSLLLVINLAIAGALIRLFVMSPKITLTQDLLG